MADTIERKIEKTTSPPEIVFFDQSIFFAALQEHRFRQKRNFNQRMRTIPHPDPLFLKVSELFYILEKVHRVMFVFTEERTIREHRIERDLFDSYWDEYPPLIDPKNKAVIGRKSRELSCWGFVPVRSQWFGVNETRIRDFNEHTNSIYEGNVKKLHCMVLIQGEERYSDPIREEVLKEWARQAGVKKEKHITIIRNEKKMKREDISYLKEPVKADADGKKDNEKGKKPVPNANAEANGDANGDGANAKDENAKDNKVGEEPLQKVYDILAEIYKKKMKKKIRKMNMDEKNLFIEDSDLNFLKETMGYNLEGSNTSTLMRIIEKKERPDLDIFYVGKKINDFLQFSDSVIDGTAHATGFFHYYREIIAGKLYDMLGALSPNYYAMITEKIDRPHLLSSLVPGFERLGEHFMSEYLSEQPQRWVTQKVPYLLYKEIGGEPLVGFGRIVAIAFLLNDYDFLGASGGNVGYIQKNGYKLAVKVDPGNSLWIDEDEELVETEANPPFKREISYMKHGRLNYNQLKGLDRLEFDQTIEKITSLTNNQILHIFNPFLQRIRLDDYKEVGEQKLKHALLRLYQRKNLIKTEWIPAEKERLNELKAAAEKEKTEWLRKMIQWDDTNPEDEEKKEVELRRKNEFLYLKRDEQKERNKLIKLANTLREEKEFAGFNIPPKDPLLFVDLVTFLNIWGEIEKTEKKFICLTGPNGIGKTKMMEKLLNYKGLDCQHQYRYSVILKCDQGSLSLKEQLDVFFERISILYSDRVTEEAKFNAVFDFLNDKGAYLVLDHVLTEDEDRNMIDIYLDKAANYPNIKVLITSRRRDWKQKRFCVIPIESWSEGMSDFAKALFHDEIRLFKITRGKLIVEKTLEFNKKVGKGNPRKIREFLEMIKKEAKGKWEDVLKKFDEHLDSYDTWMEKVFFKNHSVESSLYNYKLQVEDICHRVPISRRVFDLMGFHPKRMVSSHFVETMINHEDNRGSFFRMDTKTDKLLEIKSQVEKSFELMVKESVVTSSDKDSVLEGDKLYVTLKIYQEMVIWALKKKGVFPKMINDLLHLCDSQYFFKKEDERNSDETQLKYTPQFHPFIKKIIQKGRESIQEKKVLFRMTDDIQDKMICLLECKEKDGRLFASLLEDYSEKLDDKTSRLQTIYTKANTLQYFKRFDEFDKLIRSKSHLLVFPDQYNDSDDDYLLQEIELKIIERKIASCSTEKEQEEIEKIIQSFLKKKNIDLSLMSQIYSHLANVISKNFKEENRKRLYDAVDSSLSYSKHQTQFNQSVTNSNLGLYLYRSKNLKRAEELLEKSWEYYYEYLRDSKLTIQNSYCLNGLYKELRKNKKEDDLFEKMKEFYIRFTPLDEEQLVWEYAIGKMFFKRSLLKECTQIFEKYLGAFKGNPTLKKDNLEMAKCLFYVSSSYLQLGNLAMAKDRIESAADLAEKNEEETKRVIFKIFSLFSMIFQKSMTREKEGSLGYFQDLKDIRINMGVIEIAERAAQKAIDYGISFGIPEWKRRWEVRAWLVKSRCCNMKGRIGEWRENMK